MPLFGDDPLPTLLQSSVLRRRIAETADLPPSRQPSIPSCAPPPAGRPSAGQPSAEPKAFGSGKNGSRSSRTEGREERTFFPEPLARLSLKGWPAQPASVPPLLRTRPKIAPDFSDLALYFWRLKSRSDVFQDALAIRLPRSQSRVVCSHPGWRPCRACAGPTQRGCAACGASRPHSAAP